MNKRIFRAFCPPAAVILLLCLLLFACATYADISQQEWDALSAQSQAVAAGLELSGTDYLAAAGFSDDPRLTWVAADGKVLFDSFANAAQLPSHADREEIIAALADGQGVSVHMSSVLGQQTNYYAVRISDGTVLRLSSARYTPLALLLSLLPWLAVLAVILLASFWVLSGRLARRITIPLNKLDLEHPDVTGTDSELRPLMHRLSLQNEQIRRKMAQLTTEHENQDRRRREFTANVSHQLKTPLTSISGFAEIIRDGLVKAEDVPHFAGNIYSEAQRMINLVGDILKLSQLDEREVAATSEPIDLYESCSAVLSHLESVAESNQVRLSLRGESACIHGADQIIDEMIYNLCDNAIKYNRPGGQVMVSVERCTAGVVLTVEDTGIGIPEECCNRVFERFYRVDRSASADSGGTGLGLSIVKHGAAYHHATLTLDSKLNCGTRVTIVFPTEEAPGSSEILL